MRRGTRSWSSTIAMIGWLRPALGGFDGVLCLGALGGSGPLQIQSLLLLPGQLEGSESFRCRMSDVSACFGGLLWLALGGSGPLQGQSLPFQNWLAQEIMSNAVSSINVLTERDQVLTPSSGYHCSLFAN